MRTCFLVFIAGASVFAAAPQQSQPATITTSGDRLTMPASPARPPLVVMLAALTDAWAAELADALSANGIAAARISELNPGDAAPAAAYAIANLRNDERFPILIVLADGRWAHAATIAARAARADGLITRAGAETPTTEESKLMADELPRVIARKITIPAATKAGADTASAIAAFAREVQPLGRRGTRAARPETKRGSPRRVLLAAVGATRIGIEWGSPQKRGRVIWGTLVPWNNVWMPGADEATTLTTNAPITLGELTIPAGDHTFYTLPAQDRLDLIVSKDAGQFHTVRNAELELGRVPMSLTMRANSVEGLTFAIEQVASGWVLKLIWDDREYSAPIRSTQGAPARIR